MRIATLVLALLITVKAVYFSSAKPNVFKEGDKLSVLVNKVSSEETPLSFTYATLPFVCSVGSEEYSQGLSIGAILGGDRSFESKYQFTVLQNINECAMICTVRNNTGSTLERLIQEQYKVHW
jgi:transmembrane 9 superfamily protein 2/4